MLSWILIVLAHWNNSLRKDMRISIKVRCTTLCDKVCQWLATGRLFSPGPPVSSTNKTDRHDIAEILFSWILIVLAHWNNSLRKDMSTHSDTLSWFRANQSLLFLFNTVCFAEKHWKLTFYRHDIAEKNCVVGVKQQSLTLRIACNHVKLCQ
jgi:hypothetical protein